MATSTAIGRDTLTIEATSGINTDMRVTITPNGSGDVELTHSAAIGNLGRSNTPWTNVFAVELVLFNVGAAATAANTVRLSAIDLAAGDAAFQIVSENDTQYKFGSFADFGGPIIQARVTIAADDATPDVSGGNIFTTSSNVSATAITDLDLPQVGQIVYSVGGSNTNSSTIADSGNFNLSAAFTASLDDVLILLVQADNDYIEIGRVDN